MTTIPDRPICYTITKIKQFTGREGYGLNATITRDGKPICFVLDQADGGMVEFDWRNPGQTAASFKATTKESMEFEFKALVAYLRMWWEQGGRERARENWKAIGASDDSFDANPDDESLVEDWVNAFVDDYRTKQRFDRMAKKKVLFQLEGDKPDEWRVLNGGAYSAAAQVYLAKTYGSKVTRIWGVK